MNRLLAALLAALTLCALSACGAQEQPETPAPAEPAPVQEPEEIPPAPTAEELAAQVVEDLLSSMTLEEKVGQVFFVRCPAENAAEDVAAYHLGGYILFGRDTKDKTANELIQAIQRCQDAASVPLLIGVDEEGGTVVRLSSNPHLRSEKFASPQKLFAKGGLDAVTADTREKDVLLHALGFNVNLAPVADVSTDPADFIYSRAFGQDDAATADYVSAVTAQMRSDVMGSVLKHFPGYGNNADTHTGIALDARPYTTFEKSDLVPFESGIAAGAPFVLVSHNIVECMDGAYPASLSAKVHTLLRDTLGFTGVIVTNDLAMDAVKAYAQDGSAAVLAIQAGNDMIVTTDYQTQIPQVIAAVQSGEIAESDIDAHVFRVMHEKQALGLID